MLRRRQAVDIPRERSFITKASIILEYFMVITNEWSESTTRRQFLGTFCTFFCLPARFSEICVGSSASCSEELINKSSDPTAVTMQGSVRPHMSRGIQISYSVALFMTYDVRYLLVCMHATNKRSPERLSEWYVRQRTNVPLTVYQSSTSVVNACSNPTGCMATDRRNSSTGDAGSKP